MVQSLEENGRCNDKEDLPEWSGCCGCERKPAVKWKDSVGILEGKEG